MDLIIERLKEEARKSWSGAIGEERAESLEKYLLAKLEEYSSKLDIPKEELLKAWEENRDYAASGYYQEANQPTITAESARVFDTVEELQVAIGDKKFRCPCCEGVSSSPYKCDSGEPMSKKGDICNWNVNGLFGDMGKGIYVFVRKELKGETIFKPISWE